MNQIISCLAGGRNKMMAARAYDFYNSELVDTGLSVRTPETINNVTRGEIPLWIHSMGGHAVLKVPYSNAGQGVYTITNNDELGNFLSQDHHYDKVTWTCVILCLPDTLKSIVVVYCPIVGWQCILV